MIEFHVEKDTHGLRPDRALRVVQPLLDRDYALRVLKEGRILVNGVAANLKTVLSLGDNVQARAEPPTVKAPKAPRPSGTSHGFGLLYLDANICVVDKPPGMAAHPAPGVPEDGTLVERVAAFLVEQGITPERPPAAAGRLDRGTSGIVILTLSRVGEKAMAHAFEEDQVVKEYLALAHGVTQPSFDVDEPITVARYRRGMPKIKKVKEAVTHFERLAHSPTASLLKVLPETGRMHQIRRHLRAASHPIVGDGRYGVREDRGSGIFCLHCSRVEFPHPVDGRVMRFQVRPHGPFKAALKEHGVAWEDAAATPV